MSFGSTCRLSNFSGICAASGRLTKPAATAAATNKRKVRAAMIRSGKGDRINTMRRTSYVTTRRAGAAPPRYHRAMFHEPPRFPRGFRCASRHVGLKPDAKDLALFVSETDAAAAAVFTRNLFPGAPVILGRETIKGGRLRAIAVNSKVSNVATGEAGLQNARRMAEA